MIRLALIGCGDAAGLYSSAGPRLQGATFVAAVHADGATVQRAASLLGAPIRAAALDELLDGHAENFDAVVIHSASRSHAEQVEQAAAAGKHVLVETPLALTVEQAESVIEACRLAGVCLMAGQALRFLPSLQVVHGSLQSGQLGVAGLLRIHNWKSLDEENSQSAASKDDPNGRSLPDEVVREIDLANWCFQELPTHVYAVGRRQKQSDADRRDYVQLHLGFPEGGMAIVDYSTALPPGGDYLSLSLIGSDGAAYVDDHHDAHLRYGGGAPEALTAGRGTGHFVDQLQEFVGVITAGREPSITGADGRAALLVAGAAAESISSGRAANLEGGRYELV
jgi:myo-inositol 2-dehydrogenase/D-chiro-inositol 1-dehydrogenase